MEPARNNFYRNRRDARDSRRRSRRAVSVFAVPPWFIPSPFLLKAEDPDERKVGFTATRRFRTLVLFLALAASVVVVWVFEIGPLLSGRLPPSRAAAHLANPPAAPEPVGSRILFDGLLAGVRDGTPFDEGEHPYLHLLGRVERSGKEALPGQGTDVDYRALLKDPDHFRGRTLRVAGLLLQSDPIRLDRPVSGREWVHRTWLVDPGGDEGYVADLLERPAFAPRSLIAVDGIFLKLGTYEGKRGPRQVPFLLAREAVPVNESGTRESR
jgi:hypothetical protein